MLGKCFVTISQNVSQITHLTLGIQAAAEPSINIDTLFLFSLSILRLIISVLLLLCLQYA